MREVFFPLNLHGKKALTEWRLQIDEAMLVENKEQSIKK